MTRPNGAAAAPADELTRELIDEVQRAQDGLRAIYEARQLQCLCSSVTAMNYVHCPDGSYIWSWQLADPVQGGASGSPLIAKIGGAYCVIGVTRASDPQHAYAVVGVPDFVDKYAPIAATTGGRRRRPNAFAREFRGLNLQIDIFTRPRTPH